jgi:hypothetical protein
MKRRDPYDFRSRRRAHTPRHSFEPGGRHRAVVLPGWFRLNIVLAAAIWWLGIGGIS